MYSAGPDATPMGMDRDQPLLRLLYGCIYLNRGDGNYKLPAVALGSVGLAVATAVVLTRLADAPVARFLRGVVVAYIPIGLISVIGAWDTEFPGSGAFSFLWPGLLGLFCAWNARFVEWARATERKGR